MKQESDGKSIFLSVLTIVLSSHFISFHRLTDLYFIDVPVRVALYNPRVLVPLALLNGQQDIFVQEKVSFMLKRSKSKNWHV